MRYLATTLRNAVRLVKQVTASCQVTILLERYTGENTADEKIAGRRLYAAAVPYQVVQGRDMKFVSTDEGLQGIQVSTLQFLEPVEVTVRDRITLPDGTHPQIMSVHGAVSYPNGEYFAPKVMY